MSKHIAVDGVGVIEFPDEMDDQSIFEKIRQAFAPAAAYAEPALSMASSAIAEPSSGLYGMYELARTQDPNVAANAVNQAQQAMTYQPRTRQGQQGLQSAQEFLRPIGEIIQGASQNIGDKTYQATGSPILAAAAYSAPTALMEGLGVKGLRNASKPVSGADLYSARMGAGKVNDSLVFYHTSPSEIKEINRSGKFGSNLFFSSDPYFMTEASNPITYMADFNKDKLAAASELPYMEMTDAQNYAYRKKINEIADRLSIDDTELAEDLLTEKVSLFDVADEIGIDYSDAADASWRLQRDLGDLADEMGFDGIIARDEQGPVLISNFLGKESRLKRTDAK